MKRVNLFDYFSLAEKLQHAHRATSNTSAKAGTIYFSIVSLSTKLKTFVTDDNGFSTCKHVATELADIIDDWIAGNVMDNSSPPELNMEKFDKDLSNWQYSGIASNVDAFKNVFSAECRDVDVYSVGQISIFKTSELVSSGAGIIPIDLHELMPDGVVAEFDSAGKCLAFDLLTACGFHALRGVELMIDRYLSSFGKDTSKLKSWNDYIKAAERLIEDDNVTPAPSHKVAAMLDRMRALDRNPLMHPTDTLDNVSALTIFQLSSVTVIEMIRDISGIKKQDQGTVEFKSKPSQQQIRARAKPAMKKLQSPNK